MNTPYFYELMAAMDRDEALIDDLARVAHEKPQFREQAIKLLVDASRGQFKAGWQEEADGVIRRALGSPNLYLATSNGGMV